MFLRVVASSLLLLGASSCCTAVGCVSMLELQLGRHAALFSVGQGTHARVCIGTDCAEGTLTPPGENGLAEAGRLSLSPGFDTLSVVLTAAVTAPQPVTLELTPPGGAPTSEQWSAVRFDAFSPNGPWCAPVCQAAVVTVP